VSSGVRGNHSRCQTRHRSTCTLRRHATHQRGGRPTRPLVVDPGGTSIMSSSCLILRSIHLIRASSWAIAGSGPGGRVELGDRSLRSGRADTLCISTSTGRGMLTEADSPLPSPCILHTKVGLHRKRFSSPDMTVGAQRLRWVVSTDSAHSACYAIGALLPWRALSSRIARHGRGTDRTMGVCVYSFVL
jgi:hypothetical protein